MAIATPHRTKTLTAPTIALPSTPTETTLERTPAASQDLLAGLRWNGSRILAVAMVLIAVDASAGWSYLASYFGYFGLPVEALGLSPGEILAQGASSMLLPLAIIPAAYVAGAPSRLLIPGLLTVGGYVVFLAYVVFAGHFVSLPTILAQGAAAIAIAGAVFGIRRGFGRTAATRLILAALGLLLVASVPVASGTLDAGQKASAKQSTLRIVTSDPILPGSTVTGGQFSYSNYVLLRESDSRYWLLQTGNQHIYSIPKTAVLYIRY
jgi:hypothetical protein